MEAWGNAASEFVSRLGFVNLLSFVRNAAGGSQLAFHARLAMVACYSLCKLPKYQSEARSGVTSLMGQRLWQLRALPAEHIPMCNTVGLPWRLQCR